MKVLEIKGVRIGEGVPKTIVSLMGADVRGCLAKAEAAVQAGADMLEWRVDFLDFTAPENDPESRVRSREAATSDVCILEQGADLSDSANPVTFGNDSEAVAQSSIGAFLGFDSHEECAAFTRDSETTVLAARKLAAALPDTPLLFTFRTAREGGMANLPDDAYRALCRTAIASGAIDLVDIELRIGDDAVRDLVQFAHEHGIPAVVSHHDFERTPDTAQMSELLVHMAHLGADIPKLAVMAHDIGDALRLLSATEQARREINLPLVTMAMGNEGAIPRRIGEIAGSAATFCALGQVSAPGQVELSQAQRIMQDLHGLLMPEK